MPEFVFTGTGGRMYPESRDARNVPVGAVEPGDVRDLDGPLDGDWAPCEPAGGKPGRKGGTTPDGGKDSQPGGDQVASDEAGASGEEG